MKRRVLKRRYGRSGAGRLVKIRYRTTGDDKHMYAVIEDAKTGGRLRSTLMKPRTTVGIRTLTRQINAILKREGWKRDDSSW